MDQMDHPEDKLNRNIKTPWLIGIYGCIIQAVIIFRKQKMYSATQRVDNLEVFKMGVSGAELDAMKYQDHCNICIVFIYIYLLVVAV